MKRRRLSDDERELWQRVARSANRLKLPGDPLAPESDAAKTPDPGAPAPPAPNPFPDPPKKKRPLPMPPSIGRGTPPPVSFDLAESVGDRLSREPVRMDRNLHRSMSRGKLEPEARIDLHGMNVAQAHGALNGFILSAHARRLRLVLVITGKGRRTAPDHFAPMPARAGVLKHEVPQWLRMAPLGPLVLEVRESHRSHGGTGAYYVYLKKRR